MQAEVQIPSLSTNKATPINELTLSAYNFLNVQQIE